MYDSERATMETVRIRFEKQIADHGPDARSTAAEYMTALGAFMDRFNNGPGADSRRMGADTTGTLHRLEDDVVWAEGERHRVRRVLDTIA